MDERLKNCIIIELKDAFPNRDLEALLKLYEDFCEMDTPVEKGIKATWMYDLTHFYSTYDSMTSCHNNLINTESFFKKLLYIINQGLYERIVTALGPALYKTLEGIGMLRSFEPGVKLNEVSPSSYNNPIQSAIITTYQLRNKNSHSSENWPFSVMFQNIKAILISTINALLINQKAVYDKCRKVTNKDRYGIESIMRNIVKEYQRKLNEGFHFVSLLWEPELKTVNDAKARNIDVDSLRKDKHLVLLGDAGYGKTTSLEYLEYRAAENYLSGKGRSFPCLIALEAEKQDSTLIDMICRKLNTPIDYCHTLLEEGSIDVFVDGLNELSSNTSDKKNFLTGVEKFILKYPNTFIVLTDRLYSPMQLSIANKYILKKMERDDVIRYAKTRPEWNEEVGKKLSQVLNRNEFLSVNFTPLMINQILLSIASGSNLENGIGGLVGEYLEYLIRREYEEKREINAQPGKLDLCLMSLATLDIGKDGIPLFKAMSEITKLRDNFGTNFDTNECITLARQLGIIKQSCNSIDFVTEEYQMYFYMKAIESGF